MKKRINWICLTICVFIACSIPYASHGSVVELAGEITESQTLLPTHTYKVVDDVWIPESVTLKILPGTHIELDAGSIFANGNMHIHGEIGKEIYITGTSSKRYGIHLNEVDRIVRVSHLIARNISVLSVDDSDAVLHSVHVTNSKRGIALSNGSTTLINVASSYSDTDGLYTTGGTVDIQYSQFTYNKYGIRNEKKPVIVWKWFMPVAHAGTVCIRINQTSIYGNSASGINSDSSCDIDAKNVWWGDATGPYEEVGNIEGLGNSIQSYSTEYRPWLHVAPQPYQFPQPAETPVCCSNVLFLPGIQASRLYIRGLLGENKVWEPRSNFDVRKLMLDHNGTPLHSIYTRDIIDSIAPLPGYEDPVYKSFIEHMDALVHNKTIIEWKPYAYDWRKSVVEVGYSNHLYDMVLDLASTSRNRKVTIVAHSNGGLVAKMLINRLKEEKKEALIDSVLFVAVPHLGTPQAIGAVLHSDGQEYGNGLVVSKANARALSEHMVSAYTLMPSPKLYGETEVIMDFTEATETGLPTSTVATYSEVKELALGASGRNTPDDAKYTTPNVISARVVDGVANIHTVLDSWKIPDGIQELAIIGNNLPTTYGLKYKTKEKFPNCGLNTGLCLKMPYLDHWMLSTTEGDGTVHAASAQSIEGEKIYVHLENFNEAFKANIAHHNILEAAPVLSLIERYLVHSTSSDPIPYTTFVPRQGKDFVQIGGDDLLTLSLKNMHGESRTIEHENEKILVETYPNSQYTEVGDSTYLRMPEEALYDLEFVGNGYGAATLSTAVISGSTQDVSRRSNTLNTPNQTLHSYTFPVTPNTKGTVFRNTDGDSAAIHSHEIHVSIDSDGDGDEDLLLHNQEPVALRYYLQAMYAQVEKINVSPLSKRIMLNAISVHIQRHGNRIDEPSRAAVTELIAHIEHRAAAFVKKEENRKRYKMEKFFRNLILKPGESEAVFVAHVLKQLEIIGRSL